MKKKKGKKHGGFRVADMVAASQDPKAPLPDSNERSAVTEEINTSLKKIQDSAAKSESSAPSASASASATPKSTSPKKVGVAPKKPRMPGLQLGSGFHGLAHSYSGESGYESNNHEAKGASHYLGRDHGCSSYRDGDRG